MLKTPDHSEQRLWEVMRMDGREFTIRCGGIGTSRGGRVCCAVFLLLSLLNVDSQIAAQDGLPDQEVRQQAQKILDDPEFRYFDHLGDSPTRPESRGSRQRDSWGSSGGEGAGGPEGNGRAGSGRSGSNRRRSGKDRNNNSSSDSNNSSGSSSGSRSFGGGIGALGGIIGMMFHALAYLVLIAVCGLIVYLVVLAVLSREQKPAPLTALVGGFDMPQAEDHPPGEFPADDYLAKAHALAQQGQYREAIGQLLWGGMSSIERAELIRHRRGLTLRDYLRSLRGKKSHYNGFKSVIRLYEPVGFGRRVASYQTFQDALSGYEQTVSGLD